MSNFGQVALSIVGAVIGGYFGGVTGAMYGSQLGLLVGTALFPTVIEGPQITDLNTTSSQVGAPVTVVFGTIGVPGNVLWLAPVQTASSGGSSKGGPEVKTYSYSQSIAIGIAEATTPDGTATGIGGVQRVWENGKLVFDIRAQQEDEADQTYANRLAAAAAYAETFVLYLGEEDQLPDPTIEAYEGVGLAPAFRGLCYIVYPNRALTDAQALRHPAFKFEVFTAGSFECAPALDYSNEVLYPWVGPEAINLNNANTFNVARVDQHLVNAPTVDEGPHGTLNECMDIGELCYGFGLGSYLGYGVEDGSGGVSSLNVAGAQSITPYGLVDPPWVTLHFAALTPPLFLPLGDPGGAPPTGAEGVLYASPGSMWWRAGTITLTLPISETGGVPPLPPPVPPWVAGSGFDSFYWYWTCDDLCIRVTRAPVKPADPCGTLAQSPAGFAMIDGVLTECGPWLRVDVDPGSSDPRFVVLQAVQQFDPGTKCQYPLNPTLRSGDPDDNEGFWTAAYQAALLAGTMRPGLTYLSDYPVTQLWGYSRQYSSCVASPGVVTLADIITGICHRVALEAIDVADLVPITVGGYAINNQMSARAAIDPLRSIGFFDIVESGELLCFRTRGKPIVATLTDSDLGAFEGTGAEPPPAMTITETQDVDLPRTVRVNYIAISRDYEPGQQISESRLTTLSVNDVEVNLAVAMTDTQALQVADVLWASAWTEAKSLSFALSQRFSELEPGDCIALPVDGVLERVRILASQDSAGVLRKMTAVLDNEASYVSTRQASPLKIPRQTVRIYAAAGAVMLDLPALADADDNAGFYLALELPTGAFWSGAIIFQSLDGGNSYNQIGTLTSSAVVGTVVAPPAAADWSTWDGAGSLVVEIAAEQSLQGLTDDEVLSGGNLAAIGVDGRWQLIQFGQATQLSATRWSLTRLLQGRRGTEYEIGTGQAGDTFVLLSAGGLLSVPLTTSQIGLPLLYKAVSFGMNLAGAVVVPFTGHGRRLQTFSPVDVAWRLSGGDIVISWVRRNRLGQELPNAAGGIAMSEATLAFEVDFVIDGPGQITVDSTTITVDSTLITVDTVPTVVRTLKVSGAETATYTAAQQAADFGGDLTKLSAARVYQISAVLGRGPAAGAVGITVPPAVAAGAALVPANTLTVAFSGAWGAGADVRVRIAFTPIIGAAVVKVYDVLAQDKVGLADYAADLSARAAADFGALVTVSVVGTSVLIESTAGYVTGSATTDAPAIYTNVVQAALPVTASVPQIAFVDLYGPSGLAPTVDPQYALAGSSSVNLLIDGLTQVLRETPGINYGLALAAAWPAGTGGDYVSALTPLVSVLQMLPQLMPYVAGVGFGMYAGTTMTRPAVTVFMKDGFAFESPQGEAFAASAVNTPSGYKALVREARAGVKGFPAGAAQTIAVRFEEEQDLSGAPTGLLLGRTFTVTLDGVPYAHAVSAGDISALPAAGLNGIYADLKTQIELSGNFTVSYISALSAAGVALVSEARITRTVADTAFTYAAASDYPLIVDCSLS